ncbi:hypothetical protein [Micromonospora psammae]|uniref:hypothetical protein n=1 Tax=Micromonospora sp. CPCC 205556 TaxID=3122398 RepID=UPI002FF3B210
MRASARRNAVGLRTGNDPRGLGHWVLRRYPVSILVIAPFAILIVPMALLNGNPGTTFILRLLSVALVGTVLVETVALAAAPPRPGWRQRAAEANLAHPHLYRIARVVAVVSVVASLTGAYAGRGTIFTQLTHDVAASPLARVAALAAGWPYLAFALLVASFLSGRVGRARVLGWTGFVIAGQVTTVALTGIVSPAIGYITFAAGAGAVCGLLRTRAVVAVGVVLLLAWPSLFAIRNEIRAQGGVAVSADVSAGDRLRVDLQLAEAGRYDVPVDVGQPGPTEFLRYGLVPRILDQERPMISTGALINQYLGGVATSSYSFLALGNVYFFDGWLGVLLYYIGWASLVVLLLRRGAPGPVRLSLFCFVMGGPLLWSSTYPDSMIGFLQHAVAALPVFALLWLTRRRTPGRRAPDRVPAPPRPGDVPVLSGSRLS